MYFILFWDEVPFLGRPIHWVLKVEVLESLLLSTVGLHELQEVLHACFCVVEDEEVIGGVGSTSPVLGKRHQMQLSTSGVLIHEIIGVNNQLPVDAIEDMSNS